MSYRGGIVESVNNDSLRREKETILSILKISHLGVTTNPETRSKWTILANTLLFSVFMLSALDLLVASIRGDSIFNYTMFVLSDLALTVLGLIFTSDLIIAKGRELVTCFLGYMLFLWTCITILKLVFLG